MLNMENLIEDSKVEEPSYKQLFLQKPLPEPKLTEKEKRAKLIP